MVQDYPITTPYGYVPGYPLHNGFHQGIDYGCPVGTPVIVNGVVIGLSGNTGYTTGPHCHVGKWLNGVVQNPLNGGFSFASARVTEINEDPDDGKYVRVQGDGFSWVYCHLSDNAKVSVGQVLQGEEMFEGRTAADWAAQAKDAEQYKQGVVKSLAWKVIPGQPGGGMHEDPAYVRTEIDSLVVFKNDTLNTPTTIKPYDGPPLYVKK